MKVNESNLQDGSNNSISSTLVEPYHTPRNN